MLKPGMMIGDRYEIIDTVGSGGMSIVYKAKCHKLNRYVAIKVLKPEFASDKNFVSKFRIEAQSAAGLSHPNIVNVYDVGEDDGLYYIVMELVEGITLKEYIQQRGKLSIDTAIDFAIQIASGIETAHNNHTIHRDIKPQNIIVSNTGNLKVTDFGIARAATSNTIAANAMGSVHYISPEQARGGYSDERSDIYSLGITMYEMVTGRMPFEGDNNVTVALMHIQGEMIPPREYYPNIPAGLEKIILKATQKKAERRYLTASALIADLRKIQADHDCTLVGITQGFDDSPTKMMTSDEVEQIKEGMDHNEKQKLEVFPITNKSADGGLQEESEDEDETDEDEDLDDEKMDPKLEKIAVVFGIVIAVLAVMVVMFIIGKSVGLFSSSSKNKTTTEAASTVEMPGLVGLTIDEAKDKCKKSNLTFDIDYENSSTIEKDVVMSQNIDEGTKVKSGSSVKIVVSAGEEESDVPNVVGKTEEQAINVLSDNEFGYTREYTSSDDVEAGEVISQTPEAGESAAKGSKVTIYISTGKETKEVEVPSLLGCSKEDASAKLSNQGLKLGSTSEEYSNGTDQGKVISQSYSSGTKVQEGTSVDITISKGPEPTSAAKYKVTASGKVTVSGLGDSETTNIVIRLKQTGSGTTSYTDITTIKNVGNGDYDFSESKGGFSSNDGEITAEVDNSSATCNVTNTNTSWASE